MPPGTGSTSAQLDHLLQVAYAFMGTSALKAGVESGVFRTLAQGGHDAPTLADQLGLPQRSTRVLLATLAAYGLLKRDQGKFILTETAKTYLVPGKDEYLGDMVAVIAGDPIWSTAGRLTDVVRQNGSVISASALSPDNSYWVGYNRSIRRSLLTQAEALYETIREEGPFRRILDLACGCGALGLTFTAKDTEAQAICEDWAPVLETARETAGELGVLSRTTFVSESILTMELPENQDLIILGNICHFLSLDQCLALFRRCHKALAHSGKLLVFDSIADEDRDSPQCSMMALSVLLQSAEGDVHTFEEYWEKLLQAGFRDINLYTIEGSPSECLLAGKQKLRGRPCE
ncbi:MAG: methyltransferase domain-containing protein [Armatimonadetes bacterium]|nr:methyltransferase domain-containing protein [Armatimonadota bacterium]